MCGAGWVRGGVYREERAWQVHAGESMGGRAWRAVHQRRSSGGSAGEGRMRGVRRAVGWQGADFPRRGKAAQVHPGGAAVSGELRASAERGAGAAGDHAAELHSDVGYRRGGDGHCERSRTDSENAGVPRVLRRGGGGREGDLRHSDQPSGANQEGRKGNENQRRLCSAQCGGRVHRDADGREHCEI